LKQPESLDHRADSRPLGDSVFNEAQFTAIAGEIDLFSFALQFFGKAAVRFCPVAMMILSD